MSENNTNTNNTRFKADYDLLAVHDTATDLYAGIASNVNNLDQYVKMGNKLVEENDPMLYDFLGIHWGTREFWEGKGL